MSAFQPQILKTAAWLWVALLFGCGSADYLHKLVGPRHISFGRLDLPCTADADCAAPSQCLKFLSNRRAYHERCRGEHGCTEEQFNALPTEVLGDCFIPCKKPEKDGRGDCPWPLGCVAYIADGPPVGPTCAEPIPDEWRCWRPDGSDLVCEVRDPPIEPNTTKPMHWALLVKTALLLALVVFPIGACFWLARRRGRTLPEATPRGLRTASALLTFLLWAALFGSAEATLAAVVFGLRPWVLPLLGWSTAALFGWLRHLIRPTASSPTPPGP